MAAGASGVDEEDSSLDGFLDDNDGDFTADADDAGPQGESDKAEEGEGKAASPAASKSENTEDVWADLPAGTKTVPLEVFVATRNKWREKAQEAERKSSAHGQVQAQAREQEPQHERDDEPKAGFWDDPEQAVSNVQRRASAEARAMAIDAEARIMRRTRDDYGKAEAAFLEAMKTDYALVETLRRHEDPVGFAYEKGKELMRMQELGATNLTDLESKIEARVRAEYEAKSKRTSDPRRPAAKPPKSLASAQSASTTAAQSSDDDGDELDEVFPKR